MSEQAIVLNQLTKHYGTHRGINDLSFSVNEGEFFGFIGPNGAGKSTTIRTLMGLIHPSGGNASIFGLDCQTKASVIARDVGYLPSENSYYENMKVRELLQLSQEPISLETPVGEEEDAHLEDFIQDEDAGVPVDEAGRQLLRRELLHVLKSLTPREERVITLRFGLEDGRARTLEELGKEFNVTRERVRQIEAKALRKLRHPSRAKLLRDYLDE